MSAISNQDQTDPADLHAADGHYRYTQSQFGTLLLAVAGSTIVLSRVARYAGSWGWISHLTTETLSFAIWCTFAAPLIYVALRTRMSQSMRRWFLALVVFQTAEVLLDLTDELSIFASIPLLGSQFTVYDGHNGSLNEISQFLFGVATACCMFYVWYLAMVEADAVRDRLALKTQRLQIEIGERKLAEARIQELTADVQHSSRLNVMGEMAAGVAHELHQPLAAIANFANGCRIRLSNGTFEPNEAAGALSRIADGATRAGLIVGRIMSFVQKRTPIVALSDINEVVRDAIQIAKLNVKRQDINIEVDLATDLPNVPIDSVEVTQVVLNLALNGIDAIVSSNKPLRKLTIQTARGGDDSVLISVHDTGDGVLPDVDTQIYDQFFTTKPQGLGMGLGICRSIVGRYDGRLWHESESGIGSVFRFTLPTAHSEAGIKLLAAEQAASAGCDS